MTCLSSVWPFLRLGRQLKDLCEDGLESGDPPASLAQSHIPRFARAAPEPVVDPKSLGLLQQQVGPSCTGGTGRRSRGAAAPGSGSSAPAAQAAGQTEQASPAVLETSSSPKRDFKLVGDLRHPASPRGVGRRERKGPGSPAPCRCPPSAPGWGQAGDTRKLINHLEHCPLTSGSQEPTARAQAAKGRVKRAEKRGRKEGTSPAGLRATERDWKGRKVAVSCGHQRGAPRKPSASQPAGVHPVVPWRLLHVCLGYEEQLCHLHVPQEALSQKAPAQALQAAPRANPSQRHSGSPQPCRRGREAPTGSPQQQRAQDRGSAPATGVAASRRAGPPGSPAPGSPAGPGSHRRRPSRPPPASTC